MCRILIADASDAFANALGKQLKQFANVELCHEGKHLLESVRKFQPDVLLIDLMLPGCDPIAILHSLRTSGSTVQIVAISTATSEAMLRLLVEYGVIRVVLKPAAALEVAAFLRRLVLDLPELSVWCVETEIDSTLLYLGFQCGKSRYNCIYQGILLKSCGKAGDSVKYLYSEIRRLCGKKSIEVVEKAVRDAIRNAWINGDREIWKLYFPNCDRTGCPSNEVFISRIAMALQNRERLNELHKHALENVNIV